MKAFTFGVFLLTAAAVHAQLLPRTNTTPQPTPPVAEPIPRDANSSGQSFDTDDARTAPLYISPVDYLRLDPAISLQERSPNGVQADLSIRGTTFEQTLVLLNGIRLNDPETGHLNFDLSVPLEAVSRIDVVHGSGSTLYGSDAIGGTINLVTAEPLHTSAMLRLGGGNMGATEQHLQLSAAGKRLSTRLTGSRDTSDGFFYAGENDRGFHANLLALDTFVTVTRKLEPTEIFLGASDRPYGANGFYGSKYDSNERTKGWLGTIRQPLPKGLMADFAFRRHTDEFVLLVGRPAVYENNHKDGLWQADLRRVSTPAHHLEVDYGLEADGDGISSTNLGHHARNQGGGYARVALTGYRRFTFAAGARQEIFEGPKPIFSPSVSAGYQFDHGLRAHAAIGTGFRQPTFIDLYYSDPVTIGNPALEPETSQSYEGGLDWVPALAAVGNHPRLRLSATGFTLRQSNAIDYSKYSLTDKYQATNVGQIAYTGVETSVQLRLDSRQEIDLGESFIHAPAPPAGLISEYAYNFASHNGSAAYQAVFPAAQIAVRTQVSVVQQVGYTAYPLWSVALTRSSGTVRPYVRAQDLANVHYSELPGVPLPGRSVIAGLTFTWTSGR